MPETWIFANLPRQYDYSGDLFFSKTIHIELEVFFEISKITGPDNLNDF